MAQAVQSVRYSAVTTATITTHQVFGNGWYRFVPYLIVIAVLLGGLVYFKSQANSFAENI